MKNLIANLKNGTLNFARDEEGAQVVEYALIIAVVSIGLVVLLDALGNTGGGFTEWIANVTTCLTTGTCP